MEILDREKAIGQDTSLNNNMTDQSIINYITNSGMDILTKKQC